MQAVVGLCGNERMATRGLGQADSQASTRLAKKALAGVRLVVAESLQPHHPDIGAGKQRRIEVDRVRGRRNKRRVARTHDDPHQVREALLGPDRRHDLAVGVQLHPETPQVKVSDRLSELGDPTARRVAVVTGIVNGLGQLLDGHLRRGDVGVPKAQVDDVVAGTARLQLQLVDLREDIRRKSLNPAKLHRPTIATSLRGLATGQRAGLSATRSIERGQPQIAHVAPASRRSLRVLAAAPATAGNGPAQFAGPRATSASSRSRPRPTG